MSQRDTSSHDLMDQIRDLLGTHGRPSVPDLDDLLRSTRRKLVDLARPLGLTGLSRLTKQAIASRVQRALQAIIRATPEPPPAPGSEIADAPHKFDLGLPPERGAVPDTIPWGYGIDRVTAMAIDPERLFVYWEVTDPAIEQARWELGPGGSEGWLNLRVYDVTGRLFDGTNAHSYFDHKLDRSDRQWFFYIGKPTSTAVVEIGMKSTEGYFVRIARSGRADFPRREPAPGGRLEWLTVRTGSVDQAWHTPPPGPPGGAVPGWEEAPAAAGGDQPETQQPVWAEAASEHAASGERIFEGHWDWREITRGERREILRREWRVEGPVQEWVGPVTVTSWEAGPFMERVESPLFVEERNDGRGSTRIENGRVHVVYGPWQVIIRGIGARAERRVLGVWEIQRVWVTADGGERSTSAAAAAVPLGASEGLALGASERRWLAGSEVRLGGASEVARIGASELRYRGASETLFAGASERRLRGASESRLAGASERRLAGASERRLAGASERRLGGASEQVGAGASERRFVGASERAGGRPTGR